MPIRRAISEFLKLETASGIILLITLAIVLIIANSPFSSSYQQLLNWPLALTIDGTSFGMPLKLWINDGLMTLFFLLLALEIKREILVGELSTAAQRLLPMVAALGGVVMPAIVYLLCTHAQPELISGWAIPSATDIALSLGLMAILGKRVPASLKVFLMALAIVDDIAAILIIAIFYSHALIWGYLAVAGIGILILITFNYFKLKSITLYSLVGIVIWLAILHSGIHATLAGVAIGFCIPYKRPADNNADSLLENCVHKLHPWVGFVIVPLFVLANAGVAFVQITATQLMSVLPIAISLGLFIGKQAGIFGMVKLFVTLGWAKLPSDCNWKQLYGVAVLAGVGFTMSLYISNLAFAPPLLLLSHAGILLGSLFSALLGMSILRFYK